MLLRLSVVLKGLIHRPLNRLCLLSALVLLPLPAVAQAVNPGERDKSFLWQVNSPTNTVYLLGSLHFLQEDYYPLSDSIQAAFEDAETVVFEADIGQLSTAEAAFFLIERAEPEAGEALQEVLPPETYQQVQQATDDLGLPMAFFQSTEPWFLALSLTSAQLLSLGFDPTYGVDQYLYNQAQAAEKNILALETVEQQANLFEQLSVEDQRQLVQQTLIELDTLDTWFKAMIDAWLVGDAAGLADYLLTSFEAYPQVQQILLRDRNRNWLPQVETFLQDDEDYLVVVGAAHLVGEGNLLELLAQQGYSAEQL